MLQNLPYICEAFMLSSCLSMIIGWRHIRRKNMKAHKRWMLTSIFLATLFFICYAIKTIAVGVTAFAGPALLRLPYQIFLQIHSVLATVGAILGVITLRFGLKKTFPKHEKIGKWTVSTWVITTLSGLAVFTLLYVIYPSGITVRIGH